MSALAVDAPPHCLISSIPNALRSHELQPHHRGVLSSHARVWAPAGTLQLSAARARYQLVKRCVVSERGFVLCTDFCAGRAHSTGNGPRCSPRNSAAILCPRWQQGPGLALSLARECMRRPYTPASSPARTTAMHLTLESAARGKPLPHWTSSAAHRTW